MQIKIHCLYYGPIEENGIQLKTSPELRNGKVLSEDIITDIYSMKRYHNEKDVDSEIIFSPRGPVIRVTKITPLQSHDKRTVQSCNKTLLVKLSDISNILLPLLDMEQSFPLKEIILRVELEEDSGLCQPKLESNGKLLSSTVSSQPQLSS